MTPCVEKKMTSGRMLGVCYIISMTSRMSGGITGGGGNLSLFFALGVAGGSVTPIHGVRGSVPRKIFLDPILGGRTYLWFCAWVLHMVLGMMVFCPWYFLDLVKETTIIF